MIKKSIELFSDSDKEILISGGKDSSIVMYLCRLVDKNMHCIFNNTTLDCADTYKMIKKIYNCQIINPSYGFYQWREKYNFIPTRLSRACCTIFKEGAMIDVLPHDKKYLFFMGMRNEESNKRADYKDYWKNEKWPELWNAVLPIRKWTELEVWLYMMYRGIEFNTKYRKGYSRCGCAICCGYAGKSTWVLDKYFYPIMRERWENILTNDFVNNRKACILNCTLKEYLNQCWNSPSFREEPTEEVIQEFMELKNINDKELALKFFNKNCSVCDKKLKNYDTALSLKYFGRNNNQYYCKSCLMKKLNMNKQDINDAIKRFQDTGCNLF